MNYKEELDAITAPESLKKDIAALRAPKKHTARRIAAIAAVLVVVLLAGLVSIPAFTKAGNSFDTAYDYDKMEMSENFEEPGEFSSASSTQLTTDSINLLAGRKIIRNATLHVETKTFDSFLSAMSKEINDLSGYIQSTEMNSYDCRDATVVVRIPAEQLDTFLQCVSNLGTVTWQTTDLQDVTDEYIDTESHIKALETEQEALLNLLEKAESLTDILEIQNRLTEVRSTLETWKGQKKDLDNKIDYATVTLDISEVERITPAEQGSFFAQVKQNLSENMYQIGQGARSFALGFLSNLPYIVLWLLGIGVVVLVIWLIRRRKNK